jgi:hypothetical protein
MHEVTMAPPLVWSRSFPAAGAQIRETRRPWAPPGPGDERHGRGLLIVSRLASSWGRDGHSADGWTVWFEMDRS